MRALVVLVVGLWVLDAAGCAVASSERRPSPLDMALPAVEDRAIYASERVQGALDQITSCPNMAGNAAELLHDGEAMRRRFANARGAEVVLVKTFQLIDDTVGREALAVLSERVRAGAYVVLQYEPKVNLGQGRLIQALREAGVILVPTNALGRIFQRGEWAGNVRRLRDDPGGAIERTIESLHILGWNDHEKYWITGHRDAAGRLALRAILGGSSLSASYGLGGSPGRDPITGDVGWRDTDVELRGPVVNPIVERFFMLMEFHQNRPLPAALRRRYNPPQEPAGPAWVRFVYSHPALGLTYPIESVYRVLVEATPPGSLVRIETAYFAPVGGSLALLERALRRGTRLTILTNSVASNNHPAVSWAGRVVFARLLRIDPTVALLEWAPRPDIGEQTLHGKVASFGARGPVIVGSANFDGQSLDSSSESLVIIDDPGVRRHFDEMFLRDIAHDRARRITATDLREDPAWARASQLALYYIAGPWL